MAIEDAGNMKLGIAATFQMSMLTHITKGIYLPVLNVFVSLLANIGLV